MSSALTLSGVLDEHASSHADDVALVETGGPSDRTVTFADLAAHAADLAQLLAGRGVRRGDVVGVWLPNTVEAMVTQFALARLGAVNLGINTRYGTHELTHLLTAGRPVGIIAPGSFHGIDFSGRLADAWSDARRAGGTTRWVGWIGEPAAPVESLESWVIPGADVVSGDSLASAPAYDAGRADDLVNVFTTSGSTGLPKLAGHDQQSVVRHARNVATAFEMGRGDVSLGVLPLSGVFGFNHVIAMLLAGGTVVLCPVFDGPGAVADMARFGVTHVIGGDDLFLRLRTAWEATRPTLAFRRGGIADFSGTAADCVAWADSLGADVTGVYGSSEVFALTAAWPAGLPLADRTRGGGRLVSDEIELRIVDPDSGEVCPDGVTGEVQVRGYNVVARYLGDPAAVSGSFAEDDWFRTGDLGHQEGRHDEFVYVCRAGDALRLRGFLVEPAEIEQFLMACPGVDTAKVVGVKDNGGADVVVAFVTAAPGVQVSEDDLQQFARGHLAAFKVPDRIVVVDELPVTSGTNGTKVRTAALREWAADLVATKEKKETHDDA